MDADTIKAGADLAQQALYFAMFTGRVTSDECRRAIVVLFGSEVDAELDRRFCHGHNVDAFADAGKPTGAKE